MFRELPRPVDLEEEVLAWWKDKKIFEKSLAASEGRPRFVFYEGPPTANGTPHNGHVLTRVIKDLIPRYRTMRGYHVARKAGWDTHGLPVEVEVEKELNLRSTYRNSREAIASIGLETFSRKCVDSVFRYTSDWELMTERVGFWVDLSDAYVTYHREYVESVWWALATLWKRGLLYEGHKVVWWWPEGGTTLSAGEVGEGYRDVDDPSVTARFAVEGQPGTYLLAWTTTPWTLPSNVALAVGPDLDYAFVKVGDDVLIAADALKPEGEVQKIVKGSELVGLRYAPLFDWGVDPGGAACVVVPGAHVSLDAGTGIVHTAPAYGEDDFKVRQEHGLGLLMMVGPDGTFGADAPDWLRGRNFKEADKDIVRDLRARGLLHHAGTIRHSYPFSPRSKNDPLMQLARPGWFIRTTEFVARTLDNNAAVQWLPEHIREGRMGDFLRNNVDWALSRERYWGTPLPLWVCPDCGARQMFESLAALQAAGAEGIDPTLDRHLVVHRPWIDQVTVPCACGGAQRRVPEVIDCWFDSGCMPFAQFGWPHRGHDEFAKSFPADFISEAVDQTRGWFNSLMQISTLLFDEQTCADYGLDFPGWPRPFKTCIVLGHVCDMDGKKESKSTGNYTSPDLVLRGRMKMRVVPDASLKRGQIGLVEAAVRSLDLGPGERLTLTKGETGEGIQVTLLGGKSRGKETIGVHPDDCAELGLTDTAWLTAPFDPPGADAFRWLFYAANPPWTNTRISLRAIREGQREFHLRLANVFNFFCIYANIGRFSPGSTTRPFWGSILDRWIRVRTDELVRSMTKLLDGYLIYEAARALSAFVDDLSNWYVRRSRARFWGDGAESWAALWTLYDVLATLSRVAAPFVPFMAEAMYQRLALPGESVHLTIWPMVPATPTASDQALSDDMALIRELANLGRAAREKVGVRVRQPLSAIEVILAEPERAERLAPLLFLLKDELNVREVRFTSDADAFVEFKVKPDYPRLGKRLGKDMKACAAALATAPGAAVRAAVLGEGYRVALPSGEVLLSALDVVVEVQPRAHFQAAGSAVAVVALHADLDDDLRQEGLFREVLSRVQASRKDLDLDYTDRVDATLRGEPAVLDAVRRFEAELRSEALVVDLRVEPLGEGETIEVDGHRFAVELRRASRPAT